MNTAVTTKFCPWENRNMRCTSIFRAVFMVACLAACGGESSTSSRDTQQTAARRQHTPPSTTAPQVRSSAAPPGEVFKVGGDVTAPQIIKRVEIEIPDHLREIRRQGAIIILEGVVTTRGDVRDLRVIRGENDPLTPYILKAVREWRFRPAEKQGEPVAALYTISVNIHTR